MKTHKEITYMRSERTYIMSLPLCQFVILTEKTPFALLWEAFISKHGSASNWIPDRGRSHRASRAE